MSFNFDYHLEFTNSYNVDIINNSDVPDKSQDFQDKIKSVVDTILMVLNSHIIKSMSTFTEYQNKQYKITVKLT